MRLLGRLLTICMLIIQVGLDMQKIAKRHLYSSKSTVVSFKLFCTFRMESVLKQCKIEVKLSMLTVYLEYNDNSTVASRMYAMRYPE